MRAVQDRPLQECAGREVWVSRSSDKEPAVTPSAEKRARGNDSFCFPFYSSQMVINFDGLSKSRVKA